MLERRRPAKLSSVGQLVGAQSIPGVQRLTASLFHLNELTSAERRPGSDDKAIRAQGGRRSSEWTSLISSILYFQTLGGGDDRSSRPQSVQERPNHILDFVSGEKCLQTEHHRPCVGCSVLNMTRRLRLHYDTKYFHWVLWLCQNVHPNY